ncbi:MAG: U32 family peptidase [Bacillota bacterium]|nr:U32 family peptidase [Bacillota bacterium]
MKKIELLAPAGSLDRLKIAIEYGADAVYLGGEQFSLRAAAENFTHDELKEGIEFAHKRGKKVYVTLNIIPHNADLLVMGDFIKEISELGADAVIVSDLGVMELVKKTAPGLEIHISTQASVTNYRTVEIYHNLGAKRVVLARELSLEEIREIVKNTNAEIEVFCHGAICMSYSGRCLLSNYLAARDSNMGQCAQPCRWKYYIMEEKRPGMYMPIMETERGTFVFNSKDMCMIEHIPELIESGITSLKIEGRIKTAYYVATVVKAYREAIDSYLSDRENYVYDPDLKTELEKVSHRMYDTGFFFGRPGEVYATNSYIRNYDVVATAGGYDPETGIAVLNQLNKFSTGDEVEIMEPKGKFWVQKVGTMENEAGEEILTANHAEMIVKLKMDKPISKLAFIRKKRLENVL